MAHSSSFAIVSADDFFYEMLLPQHRDFVANNASSRHALIAIILSYHMYEWAHNREEFSKERFTKRYPLETELVDLFELARKITNGTKHFENRASTRTQSGFSSAFSEGFARPLVIVKENGSEISADALLDALVGFWKSQKAAGAF